MDLRAALSLVVLAGLGCGGGTRDVVLDLPEVEAARTLVVGVPERGQVRVRAWDLDDAQASVVLELPERGADDGPIEAAYFARGLAEAGLAAGWQEPPGAAQESRRLFGDNGALGRARQVFQASLAADAPGWVTANQLSSQLAAVSVGQTARRCAPLSAAWTSEIIPAGLGWSVLVDDQTVFMVGLEGSQWMIDLAGRSVQRLVARTDYVAAARLGDRLYAVDRRGQLWAGPGDRNALVADAVALGSPLPSRVRALTASAADDLTALLANGGVYHFDGEDWARWGEVEMPGRRLFAVGPAEAIVLTEQPRIVYRARDGQVRSEVVAETGILSAAATPLGTVAGSSDGDLLLDGGGGWSRLGDQRFGWWAMDVIPYLDGVGFLLASGTVSAFRPEVGFCETFYNGGFYSQGRLHPIGERLVALGDLPDTLETQVILLEP